MREREFGLPGLIMVLAIIGWAGFAVVFVMLMDSRPIHLDCCPTCNGTGTVERTW